MRWDATSPPTQEEQIREWIEHHLSQLHTALPCRVQSYDATNQTVDCIPLVRNWFPHGDGSIEHEELPVLPCVPVAFPRAAGHFIAFPLSEGDHVLVVFCELAIGHWWASTGGDITDPGDLARHSLSHGVAIPTRFNRADALAHAPEHSLAVGSPRLVVGDDADEGTRVAFGSDGSVKVTRGSTVRLQLDADGTVHVGGASASQFIALANLVNDRLETLRSALNSHTHAVTGTANLGTGAVTGTTAAPAATPALTSVAATKAKAT